MKYYGIANGRKIGVFDNWEIVEKYTKGYKNARFKSFKTEQEASYFVSTETVNVNKKETKNRNKTKKDVYYASTLRVIHKH